jgi:type II restriction/modification system DNA methylase subunit YeeA
VTPTAFIAKWRINSRNERAAAQEHFLDLCALLDEPTPNSDPTGAAYAFEKGATKASGGEGWADVWRRGRFAWEYKGKHKDLDAAHRQLLQYAGALENPPLLVTSDIERITIRTNWTNAVSERHEVRLEEMADPVRLGVLKSVFADPERLRPGTTRAALTAKAAADFAELAGRLRSRGNDPQGVAHFVNRLVFCLFADDVGLLPAGLFERMLDAARKRPAQFQGYASRLFAAMAERGGEVDFTPVAWFNGGLFDDGAALPLEADDIALLQRAAALDWAEVDPSILGTLFERGLDPDKRSQLGAHYTSREMIERLIEPVVRRPLLAEWGEVREQIAAALAAGTAAKAGSKAKRDAPRRAETLFRGFLDRLRAFRVLDPACGSGNFLYLALLALKDLEHQAMVEAEAIGLQREFPQVGPEAVLGLEVNPYAAELARVSVWIGHIQWARRHGFPAPSDPVLRTLDTIACRDAVLADDGSQAAWPTGDVIVGNPPFLGGKRMRTVLGDAYCARLFAAYAGQVPAEADLVCYWVARAQEAIAAGKLSGAGLVTTNSIRGGANRRVLEPMAQAGAISTAWADEPWTLDGAAVRVSLVCWGHDRVPAPMLNGVAVPAIHADLTAGAANLTTARRLSENAGVAFMGDTKGGAFDVPGEVARQWLLLPSNANGRPNADVLRPWANGMDVTRRPSDTWIIDFGWTMTEAEAAYYAAPYAHVAQHVRPVRVTNKREAYAREWWRHVEPRPGMHRALNGLSRFIVTPEVAKHRVFAWMVPPTLPDHKLQVFARDDDTTFGILHSRFHQVWALAVGSWHGVGNDPRYTVGTCYGTFPFPPGLTPDQPAASYADDPRAQAIAQAAQVLVAARDRWLNPAELVDPVPEVAAEFPDRLVPKNAAADEVLRKRTLTSLYNQRGKPEGAWLDALHQSLDTAVASAYGWPENIHEQNVLERLLDLNVSRSSNHD